MVPPLLAVHNRQSLHVPHAWSGSWLSLTRSRTHVLPLIDLWMINGVTHNRAEIQHKLGTKAPKRGHVVTLGVSWEQGPFLFPYAALLRGQELLALPAFPGPSPSAGVSAHGTLEPVWPAAGPREPLGLSCQVPLVLGSQLLEPLGVGLFQLSHLGLE